MIEVSYNKEQPFKEVCIADLQRREVFLWRRDPFNEINLCMHTCNGNIIDLKNPDNHWTNMSKYSFPITRLGVPKSIKLEF